jgi:hypothetical protein
MKRTVVAAGFVLISGIIGAAVAFVLMGSGQSLTPTEPAPVGLAPSTVVAQPNHVVSRYRVAVTFPERFEFEGEADGEVRYSDPATRTRVAFVVTRLSDDTLFEDAVEGVVRSFSRRGNVERSEYVSDTRAELTLVEVFRLVSETVVFVGQDCWGKPLLVRALYSYDRTVSPEDAWLTQGDDGFPQFEFAYRCPA